MSETQAATLPRTGPLRIAIALLAGAALGVAVALDGDAVSRRVLAVRGNELLALPPFGVVGLVLGVALAAFALVRGRHALWRARYPIAIGLVLFTSHLMGLGVGVLNPIVFAIGLLAAIRLHDRLRDPLAPFQPTAFTFMVLGFAALALLSTFDRPPREVLPGLLAAAPKLLLPLLLADVLDRRDGVRGAMGLMLWAAAIFAVVGVVQALLFYFFGIDLSLAAADYRYSYTPFGRLLRATGAARFANQFAPPLVAAALMGATLLVSAAGRGRRFRLGLLVTVTVAAVALSIVRGAWVAVAFGMLTIPFILRPERWRLWAGTLAALVAVGFATGLVPLVVHMVSGLSESSLLDRRILFAEGLRVMLAHPLTGVGILNFGWYSPSIERHPVHNAFIQVGSELGIPALLLYVALFAYVGVRLIRAMRSTPDRAVRAGLGSVLAGLIGLTFIVQGEPMAYSQFVWIFLALGEAASRVVLAGGV